MKRSFLIGSLAVLVCLLLFPGTGWGQTGASTIRGSVKDQSGALVSGATVTLTNLETNAVRTAETTTSGAFAFELVPVGDYEVRIEAKGFRKSIAGSRGKRDRCPRDTGDRRIELDGDR